MTIKPKHVHYDYGNGPERICSIHPASRDSSDTVIVSPINSGDGRTEWVWVSLADGTLLLGTFPEGETYDRVVNDAEFPRDVPDTITLTMQTRESRVLIDALDKTLETLADEGVIDNTNDEGWFYTPHDQDEIYEI